MIDLAVPGTVELLRALGVPYVWGAGALADGLRRWPEGASVVHHGLATVYGFDCSGFAQLALLALGHVRADAWHDKGASALAYVCDPVIPGHEALGDLAFYGLGRISHVMVALDRGLVIGAAGGDSRDFGDDETACVQVRPLRYRSDLRTVGRLKPEWRP